MGSFTWYTSGRAWEADYLKQGQDLDTLLKVIWLQIAKCSLAIETKCFGNIYRYFLEPKEAEQEPGCLAKAFAHRSFL